MKKLSKQYGVLGTKFQRLKQHVRDVLNLEKTERRYFILDGILTVGALILIYFGCVSLFSQLIYPDPHELAYAWRLRERLRFTPEAIEWVQRLFTFMYVFTSIWFVRFRLARRYHRYELKHILKELDYIALGNYHHRISLALTGGLSGVADSINKLVDSTEKAMYEERRIEQTKQELVTNISHDIRTPLTSVIGYLNLIVDNAQSLDEEVRSYAHIAYQKSQQIKALVDGLFELNTLMDNQEVQYQSISVENFLTQVMVEYTPEATKHDIQLDVSLPQGDIMVSLDTDKMIRVYDNLISNAFKYSHATHIVLEARVQGESLVLSVQNNGQKIEQDIIDKLFVRFYREETSRSRDTGGAGLGLAIVAEIVRLHRGTISVTSNDDNTTFSMVLPLHISHIGENV